MEHDLSALRNRFPSLPQDALLTVYKSRLERMRLFKRFNIPEDLRWLIEAKVRFSGEFPDLNKYFTGMGKSTFAKKRRAKRMGVCYKCARWTCNKRCRNVGMTSVNRDDKIQFIKDGLSKESLDDIRLTLETHPSGQVQGVIRELWRLFKEDQERCRLGNLTLKDPVCQYLRKLDGELTLDP